MKKTRWKLAGLSFLLCVGIMIAVCIIKKVYPFGDECILHIDMYHQYAPFFMDFTEKLKESGFSFYSWNLGLGSDLIATYAYYLSSPMNLLLIFCNTSHLVEWMTVLVMIKIGLCGGCFSYFLMEHYHTERFHVIFPELFYAFSGYMCAYYWNIMWLDCIWLFPLIVLGLERLVSKGDFRLYAVTLALSIWSNYYISIIICIFLVLYAIFLFVKQFRNVHRVNKAAQPNSELLNLNLVISRIALFAGVSILAGLVSSVLLLPEMKALSASGSGNLNFPDEISWYFNVLGEFSRMCVLSDASTTEGDWPNLYCGAAVFFFFGMYLCSKGISRKKKAVHIGFLAFLMISFSCNVLDFIWHGLHFPDGLPARQSFLFIFVMLSVCYEALCVEENGKQILHRWRSVVFSCVFAAGGMLLCVLFHENAGVDLWAVIVTGVFLACYIFLYVLSRSGDHVYRSTAAILAMALVILESTWNLYGVGIDTTSRSTYVDYLGDYASLQETIAKKEAGFYRTEAYERLTKNTACLAGYDGASLFSSLMNIHVADAYRLTGMEGGKNFYCYNGQTPLTSAMLGVKYLYSDSILGDDPLRNLVDAAGETYLYENKYVLSGGFLLPGGFEEEWNPQSGAWVNNLNNLAYLLGASDNMLTYVGKSAYDVNAAKATITEDGYYYGIYEERTASSLTEHVGAWERNFAKASHGYLMDLGYRKAGDEVTFTSATQGTIKVNFYQLDINALNQAYDTLKKSEFAVSEWTDNSVKGTIEVKEESDLILAIPADEGWTLSVDGEETPVETFLDAYIRVPLTEGVHTIELSYETPLFVQGLAISVVSAGVLIALCIAKTRKNRRARG